MVLGECVYPIFFRRTGRASCRELKLKVSHERPTAAEDSGTYSGHGR